MSGDCVRRHMLREVRMKSKRSFVGVGLGFLVLIAVGLSTGLAGASDRTADRSGIVPASDVGQGKRLTEAPEFSRLDRGLNSILAAVDREDRARMLGYRILSERVQVVIETAPGRIDAVARWLEDHDAIYIDQALGMLQAHVPFGILGDLDALPDVERVRKPRYVEVPEEPPIPVSKITVTATTEGLHAMGMDAWHGRGFRGAGIKVGVIDPEMGRWNQLLGTELPPQNRVSFQAFGGLQPVDANVHGTACAEIVTDLAPDIDHLYLAMVGTPVDIASAVQWMADNGVTVISMSAGWLSWGPGDGSGALADVVNAFVDAGGVWANSAGNSRLAHWQGNFEDADANGFMNFADGWEINYVGDGAGGYAEIPAGTGIVGSLIWNEWNGVPSTDLDFYLYYWDGVNDPVQVAAGEGERYLFEPQLGPVGYWILDVGY